MKLSVQVMVGIPLVVISRWPADPSHHLPASTASHSTFSWHSGVFRYDILLTNPHLILLLKHYATAATATATAIAIATAAAAVAFAGKA